MTLRPGTVVDQHLLVPYLPRLVIDWMEECPEKRDRTVEGTVAFVDISGFTKLSEGLAKHGKIGAEELAATIGECFVALLGIAYDAGGRLLKFGGDALLLLFTGVDHEARACRTAHEMRSKAARSRPNDGTRTSGHPSDVHRGPQRAIRLLPPRSVASRVARDRSGGDHHSLDGGDGERR